MPSAKKSTKTEETVVAPAVEAKPAKSTKKSETPAAAPAKSSSTKSTSSSTKSSSKKSETPAAAPAKADAPVKKTKAPKAPKEEKPAEASVESKAVEEPKVRVSPPTKESLNEDFEALKNRINGIIEELRSSGQKNTGIANWKGVLKTVKQLQQDSNRVANSSTKKAPRKAPNANGGFHKPVAISAELSKFCAAHSAEVSKACKALVDNGTIKNDKFTEWKSADWTVNEPSTRSKVTKLLCDYVKAKNLQFPDNRKFFKVDNDMKNLFKLKEADKDNDGKPIDFCRLQVLVKPHYVQ
jgi:chromatin remodeling complex protein RSC6